MLAKVACQMGYLKLRPKQDEMILDLVLGSDVFVSLPTESGKSLCYSLLPAVFDEVCHLLGFSIVIVVSPLVSLASQPLPSVLLLLCLDSTTAVMQRVGAGLQDHPLVMLMRDQVRPWLCQLEARQYVL